MDIGLTVFIIIVLLSITCMIRNELVVRLRRRLLDEEYHWVIEHYEEFREERRQYGLFERFHRLPSYYLMVLKLWRTMASFEREVGPIEQYYPLLKG